MAILTESAKRAIRMIRLDIFGQELSLSMRRRFGDKAFIFTGCLIGLGMTSVFNFSYVV